MGADVLINTTRESLVEAARAHSYRGLGVDILLECSGAVSVMMEAPDCVHPQGVLSVVSFFERNLQDFPIYKLVLNQISLLGAGGNVGVTEPILRYREWAHLLHASDLGGIPPGRIPGRF